MPVSRRDDEPVRGQGVEERLARGEWYKFWNIDSEEPELELAGGEVLRGRYEGAEDVSTLFFNPSTSGVSLKGVAHTRLVFSHPLCPSPR